MKMLLRLFLLIKAALSALRSEMSIIKPNSALELSQLNLDQERLLELPIASLAPNQFYKIMVHFIGALGIDFNITVICDDMHQVKSHHQRPIETNDLSEYDFKTNERSVPSLCGKDYSLDKVLISIIPYSITYQLKPEGDMQFGAFIEVTQSKANTDVKFINILMNKSLYKALVLILVILPLLLFLCRNAIKRILLAVINEKIEKTN